MSAKEFELRKLLEDATFYIKNAVEDETYHEKSKQCLDQADQILLENTRNSFTELSAEVIVQLAEVSLLSSKRDEQAERILQIFFQRVFQEDQFYCRALLAQATIEERKIGKTDKKGEANLAQVQHAFSFVQKTIEICTRAENKQKYQFIVYNASIKTWHIVRGLMRPGWSKFLSQILERISNLLEEADDSDFNWRCRYLNGLCKSLKDDNKLPESLKVLDKLVELTKKKGDCKFQETLFRTRVHLYKDNNGMLGNIKKETETGADPGGYKALFSIQQIKSGVIPEAQVEKELQLLMSQIAPSSVSEDPVVAQQSQKVTPIMQDRIAECGRIAVKYGLISYAEGACSTVARARQGSLRAKVLTEYTKAELLLRKPSADIDPKTGMKLNTLQRQIEDFEKRIEALKILDRAMIANKKLQDADVTIEGCILIWNIGIPLLKNSARGHIYKSFLAAASALELLEANESELRVCIHLELAKFEIEQDFLSRASLQLKKALMIDYSEVAKNLQVELKEDDNPDDFARPYDRVLKFLLKKLSLKTNLYGGDPDSMHEMIILDVENAKTTKNVKMRETLLDKAMKQLIEYEEPEFEIRPEDNLVEEEIIAAQKKFHLNLIKERKERVLIAAEISKLAIEENLVEIAYDAATLCVKDQWDANKNSDLIIAQSQAHINLAKVQVEFLLEEDIEIGHINLVTLEEDQDEREFTPEQKQRFADQKQAFLSHIVSAVKLGQQAKQSWLVFNASIEFWNNYLPIFKQPSFQEKMHAQGHTAMLECFEAMNNCFISAIFSADAVDYELNKKMLVFTNLSVLLARYFEFKQNNQEAIRVCDTLLVKQLPSHLRKTFDSIKARVTKSVSNLAQIGDKGKKDAPAKGKGAVIEKEPVGPSKTDILTSEVLSYLELIQNGNKDMIQKALDSLNLWQPNEQEEIELELNVELWCRLGRLAILQKTNAMYKVALYCADVAIKNGDEKAKQRKYMLIPVTRLRWYAVAEALYGEALYLLLDTQKQEKESQDKLLHASVGHFVESCNIASKAGIAYLVLESAKSMWNAIIGILDAPNNRKLLIKPMCLVHTYLKAVGENSDPDFLSLFYSALFQCIAEQKDWKLGEKITEEAFAYMPQTHQKVLWEAKMNFLSKLGKNVLSAISNMKESNASLMAKVWVRLARSSSNDLEQHSAYNKAIEILRKEESVEVVEVLIEYAEWMHRHRYEPQDVEDTLLLAVDTLMDIEPGWDDEDDELPGEGDDAKTKKTGKSGSSRHSKAMSKAHSKAQTKKSNAKKSVAGKSRVSKATMRSKTVRSKTSRTSKKTTTALQKRSEEEGQPLYMNCSHFDKMIRIHSMLAMLASNAQKQREYALDCHYFIMKMWEQSIFALNAQIFFQANKVELEELGFTADDQASRREFFAEIINGGEMQIPMEFTLPEKPEDWTNYELPEKYYEKSAEHEDKIMVARYTFVKPELTYLHIQKVAKLLEQHYFHIQLIPVLSMLQLFAKDVLKDSIAEKTYMLQRGRVLFNLGLKPQGSKLQKKAEESPYVLSENERRVNFEKIKALKNPDDDLSEGKHINFITAEAKEPLVIEIMRIHESWLCYSEELFRWGEFTRVKDFAKEVALHSRILQDQDSYSRSLLILAQIAFLEGESAQSLRIFMACHKYAKDLDLIEKSIVETFNLLYKYEKFEDCERLLEPSLNMLISLRSSREADQNSQSMLETKSKHSAAATTQVNLVLEFAISTILILQATLSIKLSQNTKLPNEDREALIIQSFTQAEQFEQQLQLVGYKQDHIILLLNYTKLLWEEVSQSSITDMNSVQALKTKLQQCTTFLLKSQEYLTNQVFYIGVHQESVRQLNISLPILRLLGVSKLRIAQVNTTIGVIRNTGRGEDAKGSTNDQKKVDKVLSNFMDVLTKQILAQSNSYKKNMNRYEKSISILHSALNLLHVHCEEYAEIQVEIAKNRRLLAMNKKHLRGQWRQDAIQVDKVNMNQIELEKGEDRKDQLEAKGLEGEIHDDFVNYKQEMLRNFLDIVQNKIGSSDDPTQSTLSRIFDQIGSSRIENILGTFASEFAESRANLNKEQAFYYLSLFQYAISRQHLQKIYLNATTEKHPDVCHLRGMQLLKDSFSYVTSPALPDLYKKISDELLRDSKPYQIIKDVSSLEQMKENLPGSSGFLLLQMSDDRHNMYVAYCQVSKERKFTYYVSKISISVDKKDQLKQMVSRLSAMKTSMQKTPITIDQDLENLERESERELSSLMGSMEEFFAPVTQVLNDMLHPELQSMEQMSIDASAANAKGGAKPKEDPKKAPPAKAAPAKGGKPVPGQPVEVAAYESNIPLTTGGIESVVVIVDQMFETLPVEALQVFSKVPVVSRDFNLHLHLHRLKSVGHKAEMHNNLGINKEEMRFIVDIPQNQSLQAAGSAFVQDELTKIMPGSKWDGIVTHSQHIPSEGEWQSQIANSSLFMYYSMTCLLHKFPSSLISDLSIFNKCKAMVIFDRMNSYKTLVDRNVLTSKHFSPDEQPMQQAALFTLCDVSSIVINHWSTRPEDNLEQMQALMRGTLTESLYLGNYALKKGLKMAVRPDSKTSKSIAANKSQERLGSQASGNSRMGTAITNLEETRPNIYKHNMVTIGVPFLRVQ